MDLSLHSNSKTSQIQPPMELLDLPEELILSVLHLLPIKSLNFCSLVSRYFKRLVRDQTLWKGVFLEVKSTDMTPTPRLWCSTAVREGKMYLYGGHVCKEQSNEISEVKRDLYEYDFQTKAWKELGHTMMALTEHKCVSFENNLWLVGGYNGSGYCNCVYKYDPVTQETTMIDSIGELFSARSAFTLVVHNRKMYSFGGWNGFAKEWFNDVHSFDFDTHEWKRIQAKGTLPCRRTSHSAVVYKNCMYVIAGYSGERYLNDLFEFNFETETWTDLSRMTQGTLPEARSRFCASVYDDKMYIIGGWNKVGYFSDFYSYDFEQRMWSKITSPRFEVPTISQYACVIYENSLNIPVMYLFGGYCGRENQMINRLYQHKLPHKGLEHVDIADTNEFSHIKTIVEEIEITEIDTDTDIDSNKPKQSQGKKQRELINNDNDSAAQPTKRTRIN